jgi:nitrate reductase NapAB chaperone NapD
VVTIEAADLDQSADRLKELQELPRVLMAELAQYCIEEEVEEDETVQTGVRDEAIPRPPADRNSH